MDLQVKPLRCFIAVAEEGSFSAAARRMHMTQPALSAQIKALETALGLDLFARTTRRVDLTPQGQSLLRGARRVVEESDQFHRTAGTLKRSKDKRLTIGAAFYTLDIPERIRLIDGFIEAFPDIDVEVDTRWQTELLRDLMAGSLDFVLMIGMRIGRETFDDMAARGEPTEILYPDHLRSRELRREPVRLMVPSELPMAALDPVPLSALKGHRIGMLAPGHGRQIYEPLNALLERAGAEPVIPPEPHGVGVERYGRQFRIPAITLGWFDTGKGQSAPMTVRDLEGLNEATTLSLVGNPGLASPETEAFWNFAETCVQEAGPMQPAQ